MMFRVLTHSDFDMRVCESSIKILLNQRKDGIMSKIEQKTSDFPN